MNLDQLKENFHWHVKELQISLTQQLEKIDPGLQMEEDLWQRKDFSGQEGGGGITRSFNGETIENAGVNTSLIFGAIDPQFARTLNLQKEESQLWAAGISLIIHPRNPRVPTVHANFRMIHAGGKDRFWFGGGADLTPYYPFEEDFKFFHQTWKRACAPYGCYDKMKKTCDEYFVNAHRGGEMRGIGGIFFDHYHSGDAEKDYQMVVDLSQHFIPSYFPLVLKRKDDLWTSEDEDFQLHRRGRYVEFNLLHDRGTSFGLKTNGRTDSILISLPARCKFTYKYQPQANGPHAKMLEYYWPHDWVG